MEVKETCSARELAKYLGHASRPEEAPQLDAQPTHVLETKGSITCSGAGNIGLAHAL